MKLFLNVFLALFMLASPALADKCKSTETIPVAEIEALLKSGMYDLARQKLEKVVADCPDSYKARQYLYMAYDRVGMKAEAAVQKGKAEQIVEKKKEDESKSVGLFFSILLAVMFSVAMVFVLYMWMTSRKEERESREALRKQQREAREAREAIYDEVLSLRATIEEMLTELTLDGKASEEYLNNLREARAMSSDLVEVCLKDIMSLNVQAAQRFLSDARDLIQFAPK